MAKLKAIYDNETDIPAEVKEYYLPRADKWVLDVDGIKTDADVTRVQTALSTEKAAHRALRDKYAPLADLDVADIVTNLDRIPELEIAAGTGADQATKVQQMVDAKLAAAKAPLERQITTLTAQITAKDEAIATFSKKEKTATLEKAVLTAARELDVDPSMEDDVLRYAQAVMDIDDQGNVVTKDNVGVTPGIDPKSLFTDMIRTKPRWFKDSVTAGLTGGTNKTGTGVNPFKAETKNLTEQARIIKSDPTLAKNLAKQAGIILPI